MQQWEDELIRPTANELIDRFAFRGRAELVREFAWEFPVRIIAKMVGVPQTDFAMWQQEAIELERTAVDWHGAVAASKEVQAYFGPQVEERRRDPQDDVSSMLAEAEIEGTVTFREHERLRRPRPRSLRRHRTGRRPRSSPDYAPKRGEQPVERFEFNGTETHKVYG